MNLVQNIGRIFFGLFCVASGIFVSVDLQGKFQRRDAWTTHMSEIAVVVCCLVAAYALLSKRKWYRSFSAVVAANAILGGLLGFNWKTSPKLGAIFAALEVAFLAWLFVPSLHSMRRVAKA